MSMNARYHDAGGGQSSLRSLDYLKIPLGPNEWTAIRVHTLHSCFQHRYILGSSLEMLLYVLHYMLLYDICIYNISGDVILCYVLSGEYPLVRRNITTFDKSALAFDHYLVNHLSLLLYASLLTTCDFISWWYYQITVLQGSTVLVNNKRGDPYSKPWTDSML